MRFTVKFWRITRCIAVPDTDVTAVPLYSIWMDKLVKYPPIALLIAAFTADS